MKKAYKEVLGGFMPNSTHVTCMAHMMNPLDQAFRKPFDLTNKYVKAANAIFWNAGTRKARYLRYLSQHNVTPKMPPNPIGTRWNCWFDAVNYHKQHLELLEGFTQQERDHCGCMAPESLTFLQDLFTSSVELLTLKAKMRFIVHHCEAFVHTTDIFQSQEPMAVKIFIFPFSLFSILTSWDDFSALPGMTSVLAMELKQYQESLGPKAVKASGGIPIDLYFGTVSAQIFLSWQSMPSGTFIHASTQQMVR
ncbi:LOW QUALITY PROTEIN: CGG triplet repeat-binding protein 1 [Plakobranchus ocellatus]|uniref:CGG triplet repeat-binding protein 1 n=1 Tax=Plakobranchus ocellatus TaxID=259542 RepID=A0AAV4A6H6_9GAST|nr:LOW QUALITY PROTEIN: CGG triplet repeat-binding protein 1 [Plakobranchus ocellatus]